MTKEEAIQNTIDSVCQVMYTDSRIKLDPALVRHHLEQDVARGASLPTSDEIELLVSGDDDGMIPTDLIRKHPNLHEYLDSFF